MIRKSRLNYVYLCLFVFVACRSEQANEYQEDNFIDRQWQFIDSLEFFCSKIHADTNDLAKDKVMYEFEEWLNGNFETMPLVINWIGILDNINSQNYQADINGTKTDVIRISFNLNLEVDPDNKDVNAEHSYIILKEKRTEDLLFNQLNSLSDGSIVTFDAIFNKDDNENIIFKDDLNFGPDYADVCNPKFNIMVTSIKPGIALGSLELLEAKTTAVKLMMAYDFGTNNRNIDKSRIQKVERKMKNQIDSLDQAERKELNYLYKAFLLK